MYKQVRTDLPPVDTTFENIFTKNLRTSSMQISDKIAAIETLDPVTFQQTTLSVIEKNSEKVVDGCGQKEESDGYLSSESRAYTSCCSLDGMNGARQLNGRCYFYHTL